MARQLGEVRAVLFDRDGTLVHDQPAHLGDPTRVRCVPGAAEAVARLRSVGIPVGVVGNHACVGRGEVTAAQLGVCATAAEVYADRVEWGSGQLSGGGADGESGNGGGPASPHSR